jgi:serine/threonine-protein kinase
MAGSAHIAVIRPRCAGTTLGKAGTRQGAILGFSVTTSDRRARNHRHRVLLELGRGGMGTVYLALALGPAGFRKLKVVKRLHPELAADPTFAAMFLDEARLAARLNHPNVVQTNEVGAEGNDYYLEMEYLEGQSLHALLRRANTTGGLPYALGASVVAQALAGLHHAHCLTGMGGAPLAIVHRDVSPHNLFVTYEGVVKVLDFGIAKAADAHAETGVGTLKGKLTYMAPEQAAHRAVDHRADIYSLGIVFWEILARQRLWEGRSDREILLGLDASRHVDSPSDVGADVPRELEAVCMRCLEPDPADRWASAEDALVALERCVPEARSGARELGSYVSALFEDVRRAVREQIDERIAAVERGGDDEEDVDPPVVSRPGDRPTRALRVGAEPTVVDRAALGPTLLTDVRSAPSLDSGAAAPLSQTRHPRPRRSALRTAATAAAVVGVASLTIGGLTVLRRSHTAALPSHAVSASTPPPTLAPASASQQRAGSPGSMTVLILGIRNDTHDAVLDGTLDAVLQTALRRSPRVEPFAGADLRELATETGAAQPDEDVARRLVASGATSVVTVRGDVSDAPAGYALHVRAEDGATGEIVLERTVSAAASGLVPAVGELAWALRGAAGDPAAPADADDAARTGLSPSLDADHEWVLGRDRNHEGDYSESSAHFRRAIAVDPDFALARASLAIAIWDTGDRNAADVEFRRAFKWVDTIGERDRLSFLGDYYSTVGDYDRAVAAYEELLEKWPDDLKAGINLSVTYQQKGDEKKAVERGERVAMAHPRSALARSNLVSFYLTAGAFEDATREGARVVAELPQFPTTMYATMAAADVLLARNDEALAVLSTMAALDPQYTALARADVDLYEGRPREALALSQELAHDGALLDAKDAGYISAYVARARLGVGDREGAARASAAALQSDDVRLVVMGGIVAIDAGHPEKVLAAEARLDKSLVPDERASSKVLAAEALRVSGHARDAVTTYLAAIQNADSWLARFGLGLSYFDLHAYAEAYTELQTCWSRRGEAANYWLPSTHLVPPVLYWLARAEEAIGNPGAPATYAKFLALRAGRPDDALAADATRRSAAPR